jgi:trimethylamine:corrinoid methyltransferase-like protein
VPGIDRPGLDYLSVLTEPDVQRIHTAALEVLSRTGLVVLDDQVLILLDRAGCPVNYEERHKGAFVTAGHTLRHFRHELLTLGLLSHQPRETWQAAGAPDLRARARDEARRLLADHHPPPLPDGVAAQLDTILKEADKSLGDGTQG